MNGKIYVHMSHFQDDALIDMRLWVDNHKGEIIRVNKAQYFVVHKDSSRHYFLGEHIYSSWCKGRDYILDGKHYRSGYEIKEQGI